jgi:prepilin-type N-terminal cleavage/methylation domain-containing protein
MSRPLTSHSRARLRGQRGFTLVELLVGMAAGLVVASGLFTILDVTLRSTTQTFSRVDATQRARTTLEKIENVMHSACVENHVVPIRSGSTGSSVNFFSQYGNGVTLTPAYHTLSFSSTTGSLVDTIYPAVETATLKAPNWQQGTPATSTTTLLDNVAQSGATPVFQYFSSGPSGQTLVSPPIDETKSESITEVRMTLLVKPGDGANLNENLVPDTVVNSVVFRLSPFPNPGTPTQHYNPCE